MNSNLTGDTLHLFIKKDKKDFIEKAYSSFGWTTASQKENRYYEDTIDVTLNREHNIKNKDDLLLLQVYLDSNLAKIGTLEKKKYTKTILLGSMLGCFSFLLLFAGLFLFFGASFNAPLLYPILFCSFSLILGIITTILVIKTHKKEKETYIHNLDRIYNKITSLCFKAQNLLGDNNEEHKTKDFWESSE